MSDVNIALIVIAVVICVMMLVVNVYVLVHYQHPDDNNQAYFPKFVVIAGLTVAQLSILMLPADVANTQACVNDVFIGACHFTLPMKTLWYIVWMVNAVFVFFIIPFSMFYYEADEEKGPKRIFTAIMWTGLTAIVIALILGILYALVGYVDFPVRRIVSATVPLKSNFDELTPESPCVSLYDVGKKACSAFTAGSGTRTTWTLRVSFVMYVIALCTITGSILFSIFGGVGIAALPLFAILTFLKRPKTVITRSEYIKQATELGKRALEIKQVAEVLQKEEKEKKKGWNWRKNYLKLQKEVVALEEDESELSEKFPQGESAEVSWMFTMLTYIGYLVFGIVGFILSFAWILHIILYTIIQPSVSSFLNQILVKLDDAWGLLGTVAFFGLCFYLLLCVMAGAMNIGFNLLIITIHPMRPGNTLMSSFLFNVALILSCSISIIQFCAKAFSDYAKETIVLQIFGHTLQSLRGIKYLFMYNVFQISFVIFAFLSLLYNLATGLKKGKKKKPII